MLFFSTMQKSTIKFLVFAAVGLLLGLLIGRTDIFTIFLLAIATGLVILAFAIPKIIASFSVNSSSNTSNYIGLTALAFIASLVTSFITLTNIIDKKQKFAEYLIPKIEQYRQKNSKYPQTLDDLVIEDTKCLLIGLTQHDKHLASVLLEMVGILVSMTVVPSSGLPATKNSI
jgi:uncharacterized protein YacL